MKLKYGICLQLGLVFSAVFLSLAVAAGQPSDGTKAGESAKLPAPKIDGFWLSNEPSRAVLVFGKNFLPPGAASPLVTIGGKPSLYSHAVTDDLLIALPQLQQQAKGLIAVETRAGSPPKTIARTISSAKLGMAAKGTTINGIWPDHGPAGTFVFIFGSGFEPNKTRVMVNQTSVPLTQIIDQTLLIAQVPAGAANGPLFVQIGGKRTKSKTAFVFSEQ